MKRLAIGHREKRGDYGGEKEKEGLMGAVGKE